MSIVNIIKTVLNQHPLVYDWIMLAVSIIIIIVCLILYLTKSGIAFEEKIRKYR
jgi:divalent metal cation (Fe/Co/Zn/Cd) transporter